MKSFSKFLKEGSSDAKKLNCLYLHGLGAEVSKEVKESLSDYNLFYPQIDYDGTTKPYYECLKIVNDNRIDFIVGHSVGGVMAYWLAKEKNIPAMLVFPAFGDEYTVYVSKSIKRHTPKMLVVIGKEDEEVNPIEIREKMSSQPNSTVIEIDSDHDIESDTLKELVFEFSSNLK